jgi:replicative DNA helicase
MEIPVALFTLEMSEQEVTQRLVSMNGKIDSQRLRTGQLTREDWERFTKTSGQLSRMPLSIDDSGTTTIMEMRSKARRLKAKNPDLGMIIVDYVQLMIPDGRAENRVQEVSQISRGLKVLARELRLPILAMSQLNRQLEGRHDKRPLLSDLRESGSLEQDADMVMFIYRDDYYKKEESEQQGIAEIIIGKQRNGPIGTVHLSFISRYARFANLD